MSSTSARSRITRAVAAVAAAALGGCMPFHHSSAPANAGPAFVFFTNESLDQADVFAVGPGGADPVRIGTVMAGRTDTLTIPTELTAPRGPVNIVARLTMSRRNTSPATGPVWLYPAHASKVTLRSDEGILGYISLDQ